MARVPHFDAPFLAAPGESFLLHLSSFPSILPRFDVAAIHLVGFLRNTLLLAGSCAALAWWTRTANHRTHHGFGGSLYRVQQLGTGLEYPGY